MTIRSDDGNYTEVTVQDNGVGIAPDVLPNIFNRFYKSRDSSGTGLGCQLPGIWSRRMLEK